MHTPLIAGNWKMHKTVAETISLLEALLVGLDPVPDREALVCLPLPRCSR